MLASVAGSSLPADHVTLVLRDADACPPIGQWRYGQHRLRLLRSHSGAFAARSPPEAIATAPGSHARRIPVNVAGFFLYPSAREAQRQALRLQDRCCGRRRSLGTWTVSAPLVTFLFGFTDTPQPPANPTPGACPLRPRFHRTAAVFFKWWIHFDRLRQQAMIDKNAARHRDT